MTTSSQQIFGLIILIACHGSASLTMTGYFVVIFSLLKPSNNFMVSEAEP